MASYPGAIVALTNPTGGQFLDTAGVIHSAQHANANDEIEAIEGELGINPKGAYATVAAKLADMATIATTQTLTGQKTFSAQLLVGTAAAFITMNGGAGNHAIEFGRQDGTASTPYIDMHAGATAVDYDVRIMAMTGTGSSGQGQLNFTLGTALFDTKVATTAGVIVRGFTAQSGDLQQWQDVGTATLSAIGADGSFKGSIIQHTSASGSYITIGSGSVNIINRTTITAVPAIIRGMASQSGDLTQWQDSGSVVLAAINSAGGFRAPNYQATAGTGPYFALDTASIIAVNRNVVTNVTLRARGMAAQTGNIFQVETSAAAMLMGVTAGGTIISRATDGFRHTNSATTGYGVLYRNDGTNMYTLLTALNDPDGTWTAARPFYIVLSSGRVKMEAGVDVLGGLTSSGAAVVTTNDDRLDATILTLMGVF